MHRTFFFGIWLGLACNLSFGQVEVFVPHVVDGRTITTQGDLRFETEFFVQNLSGTSLEVKVSLTRNDGSPMRRFLKVFGIMAVGVSELEFVLEPRGMGFLRTFRDNFTAIGWAKVVADGPIGVITSVRLIRPSTSEVVASVGMPAEPPFAAFASPAQIGFVSRAFTGFALLNTSEDQTATVNFELVNHDGTTRASAELVLPPLGKINQFLNERDLFPEIDQFLGSVEVTSDVPLSVAIIQVEDLSWSAFRPFSLPSE